MSWKSIADSLELLLCERTVFALLPLRRCVVSFVVGDALLDVFSLNYKKCSASSTSCLPELSRHLHNAPSSENRVAECTGL